MADREAELIFEHLKSQAQFAYFQLGAAGSAIAYALHETEGHSLKDTPWPFFLAVVLWALSFGLGCVGMDFRQRFIHSNAGFLRATRGLERRQAPDLFAQAEALVMQDGRRPVRMFDWQLLTLFAGAILYIGGHVMELAATPLSRPERVETSLPTQSKR